MTSVSSDLTGEIALITGCAGLLGPVHADALIRCGAFVVVTDIDEERALQTAHRLADEHGAHKVIGLRMDVTDRAGVAAAQRQVLDEHGCVGVLVNNAAIDPKVDSEGGGGRCLDSNIFRLTSGKTRFELALPAHSFAVRYSARRWQRRVGVLLSISHLTCR